MWKAHDIAKKQHRERAQPTNRRKYGLLEKKKDYKLRAEDYHKKQAHLRLLRTKAEQANEDEFNFGMIRSRTQDGVRVADRGNQALSNDAVKLLKTQDEGYIRALESTERNKVDRQKGSLVMPGEGKHTVFLDNEKEAKAFNPARHFDTDPSLVKRRENRLRNSQLSDNLATDIPEVSIDNLRHLKKRIERQQELTELRQEVDLQRELMKKGDKRKIVKDGKVTYKWDKVRKR